MKTPPPPTCYHCHELPAMPRSVFCEECKPAPGSVPPILQEPIESTTHKRPRGMLAALCWMFAPQRHASFLGQTLNKCEAERRDLELANLALRRKCEDLKTQRDEAIKSSRGMVCGYCFTLITQITEESSAQELDDAFAKFRDHDRSCPCNPMVKEMEKLRSEWEATVKANAELGTKTTETLIERDQLQTEIERLQALLDKDFEKATQLWVKSLHIEGGNVRGAVQAEVIPMFGHMLAAMFDASPDAQNYIEVTVQTPKGHACVLTFQKQEGQTPHQLRAKAEADLKSMTAMHDDRGRELYELRERYAQSLTNSNEMIADLERQLSDLREGAE
jgi:predicted ester cyclase